MNKVASQSEIRSILAVDVGSCQTKAALFDVVEGQHRFIASGEALTSLSWPTEDVSVGVRQAIEKIERICDRQFLGKNGIIVPERIDGTGVDFFTTTTTAGGCLRLLTITSSLTFPAFQDLKAVAAVLGVEAEDILIDELGGAAEARQSTLAMKIRAGRPHAIFVVGQAANSKSLVKLGDDLAEAMRLSGIDAVPVRFAGEPEAVNILMQGATDNVDFRPVPLPNGGHGRWIAVEQELQALWQNQVIEKVPGFSFPLSWQNTDLQHSSLAFGDSVRFLANFFQAHVVGLDIGASHVSILDVGQRGARATMSTRFGVGRNAISLLHEDESTEKSMAPCWLSLEMSSDEIDAAILNKWARPWTHPETEREALFECALCVESVQRLRAQAKEQPLTVRCVSRPGLVVGTGSSIVNQTSTGRKILTILDALEPSGVFEVAIDRHSTMAHLGAVARGWPQAAAEIMLADSLEYLGICVSAAGPMRAGEQAATLELKQESATRKIEVETGEFRLVPLEAGRIAELTVKPHGGLDFGWGKGKTVTVKLKGVGPGLIVDTRGRPIGPARKEQIRRWIETLDQPPNSKHNSERISLKGQEEVR